MSAMHELATINTSVISALSGSNVKPSSRVELLTKAVEGTGYATLTGTNTTDADISIILAIVDAGTVALQPVETNTGGSLNNLAYTGANDRNYLVNLEQDTVDAQYSTARVGESTVRSIKQSSQGNLIQITEDVSTLVHTPILTLIGTELKAETSVFGDEINFDGGISLDGTAPETARRISFGNDLSTIYSQFRTFSNGELSYRLEPDLLLDVPDGTVVNLVSGGRLITITDGTDTENYPQVTSDKNFIERINDFSELIQSLSSQLLHSDFNLGGTATLSQVTLGGDTQDTTLSNALATLTASTATYQGIVTGYDASGIEIWAITSSLGVDTTQLTGATYSDANITFSIDPTTVIVDIPTTGNSLGFKASYTTRDVNELIPSVGVNPIRIGKKGTEKSVTFVYTEKPAVEFDYRNVIAAGRINPICLGDQTGLIAGIPAYNTALVNFYTQRKALALLLTDPAGAFTQTSEVTTPATPATTITSLGYLISYHGSTTTASNSATYLFIPTTTQPSGFLSSLNNVAVVFTGAAGAEYGVDVTISGGGLTGSVSGRAWFNSSANNGNIPFSFPGGVVTSYPLSDLTLPNSTAPVVGNNPITMSGFTTQTVTRITIQATPASTSTVTTSTTTWTAQSADIALSEALYTMMLSYLGRIAQNAAAIADWTLLFDFNATAIQNNLGPQGENSNSNTAYVKSLEADFKLMLIDNGILPDGFEASGCWQDYPEERYHWVDDEGYYLPAHTNRLYVSAVLNEDGQAVSTQEFAFGIVVDGEDHLKEGDTVTINFGQARSGGVYAVGSSFLVNVKGQIPVVLSGGVDFNPVQIWSVDDGNLYRKFARDTTAAVNPVFNDIDLSFELSANTDYNLGDFFKITYNTLGFTQTIDAGPTAGPLLLQDQTIAPDIQVAFSQGNYAIGDTWTYSIPAAYGSLQALTPTEFCHQTIAGNPAVLALTSTAAYDLAVVAGTDGDTVEFTNATGTKSVTVIDGIALVRYQPAATSAMSVTIRNQASPAASVRVKWVWMGLTIKLMGHASASASQTLIDRFGRQITGYTLKWNKTSYETDLKLLSAASSVHRKADDLPALLLPACQRDDLIVAVELPRSLEFDHLTRFSPITSIGTMQLRFLGVEF